jgi:hypothetical protein
MICGHDSIRLSRTCASAYVAPARFAASSAADTAEEKSGGMVAVQIGIARTGRQGSAAAVAAMLPAFKNVLLDREGIMGGQQF